MPGKMHQSLKCIDILVFDVSPAKRILPCVSISVNGEPGGVAVA